MLYIPKHRHRSIYFSGQITLAALPLVFMGFLIYQGMFTRFAEITVTWFNQESIDWHNQQYPEHQLKFPIRKFMNIALTGKPDDDQVLKRFNKNISEMISKRDSVGGVALSFTAHTQYRYVISAIDFCSQVPDDNFCWILYENQLIVLRWNEREIKKERVPEKAMPL